MQKKCVLILVEWYFPIGGVESFVWHLADSLPAEWRVVIGVQHFGPSIELPIKREGIKIVVLKKGKLVKGIEQIINEDHPDVIHTNHVSSIGLAALRLARKYHLPLLTSNHQAAEYKSSTWKDWLNPLVWWWYIWFDNHSDLVTVPSKTVANLYHKHGAKRVEVLSCGVDTQRFHPANKIEIRKKLQLPANEPILLFVGRFGKDKNLDLLITAFQELLRTHAAHLILVGGSTVRDDASGEIPQLVKTHGLSEAVTLTGYLPNDSEEIVEYYQAADVFVLPSWFETQSIVALEALASGLPAVVSNSGALPELVTQNVNGKLFKRGDAHDLAVQLIEILSEKEKWADYGEESRKVALQHTLEQTGKRTAELYDSILLPS